MIDTGSEVNLLKIHTIKQPQDIDTNKQVQLRGIAKDLVPTLGTIKITLLGKDVTFHVVENDFPIKPHGILGTEFFIKQNASIHYSKKQLEFEGNSIPFVNKAQIMLPARSKTVCFVNISNSNIKEGYLPRLNLGAGIHAGNALVRNQDGKAYLYVINSNEMDTTITIPTVELEEFEIVTPEPKQRRPKEIQTSKCVIPIPALTKIRPLLPQDPSIYHTEASAEVHSFLSPGHYAETFLPLKFQESLNMALGEEIQTISEKTATRMEQVLNLISTEHMNPEEKLHVQRILCKYHDLFHLPDEKLGHTNAIQHGIQTMDPVPVNTKQYRFPPVHKKEIDKQVKILLENEIIKPSLSPYNSPIWIVSKKPGPDGEPLWRMVIDFRDLNERTVPDAYPLPNINEILDQLGGAKYFSVFDLASGFHQIPMKPEDAPKTAFSTPHGHYEFVRMPFGLCNAPATFQRLMDHTLTGLQGTEMFVYLDDIVLYASSLTEHLIKFKKLAQRLREANLKLQPSKCKFLHKEVAYLGHIITEDGVKPDLGKIEAVRNYPIPSTPKGIKQFLGLTGYYRRFIPDFSKIARPLTQLLKRDTTFEWGPSQKTAFDHLRLALQKEPILQYPNFDLEFHVTTDASEFAIGGILSQNIAGKELPIAYASRLLNKAEINYATIEKELLAIVYCVRHFRPYLYGRKFILFTDHRPLIWLHRVKDPTSRLVRWRLKLAEYEYEIRYQPGKSNKLADALSRNPPTVEACPIRPREEADEDWVDWPTPKTKKPCTTKETKTPPKRGPGRPRGSKSLTSASAPTSKTRLRTEPERIQPHRKVRKIPTPIITPSDSSSLVPQEPISSKEEENPENEREQTDTPYQRISPPQSPEPQEQADPDSEVESNTTDESTTDSESSLIELNDSPEEAYEIDPDRDIRIVPSISRDPLSLRKETLVFFLSADGKPCDEGAKQLQEAGELTITSELTLGRVHVSYKKGQILVGLVIKETQNTPLTTTNWNEALSSLKDVVRELIIYSFSIAKTVNIDQLSWQDIITDILETVDEEDIEVTICLQIVQIPEESKRQSIITENHASALAGHKGVTKTYNRIRHHYFWKGMKKAVEDYIRKCEDCQRKKLVRVKTRQPMILTDTPGRAFDKVALDIVGPLPTTREGNTYILTMQDLLTKYFVCEPLKQSTSVKIADAFIKKFICQFGAPRAILTDQGANFTGKFMKTIAQKFKIEQFRTTAFHPQSNGSLERSHLVLTEYLKMFIGKYSDWDEWTDMAAFSYNTSVHEGTGYIPHELVFGKIARVPSRKRVLEDFENETYNQYLMKLNTRMQELQTAAAEKLNQSKLRYKKYYDRHINEETFKPGDPIFVLIEPRKGKFGDQYSGPHTILEVIPSQNLRISWKGKTKIIHANKARLGRLREDPG